MSHRLLMPCVAALLVSLGCASTTPVKRTDPVTILLINGDKIDAEVMDVHNNKIVFKAQDWKKAYEYGEVINLERVKGIELRDGRRLSVKEYDAFRKGERIDRDRRVASRRRSPLSDEDLQYSELQDKPISEMTDNEFAFFMMMKERELEAEKAAKAVRENPIPEPPKVERPVEVIVIGPQDQEPTVSTQSSESSSDKVAVRFDSPPKPAVESSRSKHETVSSAQLQEIADALFEANLAIPLLSHLSKKRVLSAAESSLRELIENNREWQDKLEDLIFINRSAERALERAFLYNPDDLKTRLGLDFDQNADLDYRDLMAQLHRKFGEDVKMADFRAMLDVIGENGSRAVRELLENYDAWQFAMSQENRFVTK